MSNLSYIIYRRDVDSQTPCHAAVLGGRPPNFPEGTGSSINPVTGTRRLAVGCYNYLAYYLHDARIQCKCLQHLLKFGGDLGIKDENRETPRDIAAKLRKMEILELIEFYCMLLEIYCYHNDVLYFLHAVKLQMQASTSGGSLTSGMVS